MRLEQLEAREVPAIVQTGLPTWLSAGPSPAVNSLDETGIVGPTNPFAVVPDGDPPALFSNPAAGTASGLATVNGFPNVLFASGAGGGVWRTGNANAASPGWQPLTDGLPSLSITGIDIDPANGNRLVAAIGQDSSLTGAAEGDRLGIYISDNALAANPSFRVASVLPGTASAANRAQVSVFSAISRGGVPGGGAARRAAAELYRRGVELRADAQRRRRGDVPEPRRLRRTPGGSGECLLGRGGPRQPGAGLRAVAGGTVPHRRHRRARPRLGSMSRGRS